MSVSGRRLIELSHVIRDGLVTYPGPPAPVIEGMVAFPVRACAVVASAA